VQKYFVQHGRYTAGTATHYKPALLTGSGSHQALATGLQIGKRFHSAPVVRMGDGKQMQMGAAFLADGRWRVLAFAGQGDAAAPDSPINRLCAFLMASPESPLKRFTPAGADVDSVIDVRAVFQQSYHTLAVTALPALLFPHKGRLGQRDYEKAFCALDDESQNIYGMRGIDRQQGCLVVLRPDQYVAQVLPLGDAQALTQFFAGFMLVSLTR
jgi:phenol 2-monooxygenase